MAFMMPVMKNNYDIYKDTRSRKTSEGSNSSSNGIAPAMGVTSNRSRNRKVSECKSESFATSPSHQNYPSYRMQLPRTQSHRGFNRSVSRTSTSPGTFSPSRSFCQQPSTSPPNTKTRSNNNSSGSQNDISKFHLRLVDKLRKSFRKESNKRS